MLFNSPLSIERAEPLIRKFDLPPGARVLDAGCGWGEFLMRVVTMRGASGLGIDRDADCIARARAAAASRALENRCEFRVGDMRETALAAGSFDLAICLGATHAFAGGEAAYPSALRSFATLVRPGGQVLIGEGYWKQPPAPEYLALLGDPVGIYHDHAGNMELARQLGWTTLFAAESSAEEWDAFEAAHAARIEQLALANPTDAALAERLARSRRWYDGYRRWGRSTMGFGFYVTSVRP